MYCCVPLAVLPVSSRQRPEPTPTVVPVDAEAGGTVSAPSVRTPSTPTKRARSPALDIAVKPLSRLVGGKREEHPTVPAGEGPVVSANKCGMIAEFSDGTDGVRRIHRQA